MPRMWRVKRWITARCVLAPHPGLIQVAHRRSRKGALDHMPGGTGRNGPENAATIFRLENGLLPMLTSWLPLVPCGDDAPGLEFVAVPIDNLLPPNALPDQSLRATHASEKFWKPLMQPGDVVLFRSGVIHRTHVTPAMQSDRTNIELRFVAANRIPPRLAHDRFIPLD